jgi:sugar phosphate isomerase/epimerase
MSLSINRRQMIVASSALTASAITSTMLSKPVFADETPKRVPLLGFSLYGMKSLSLAAGLKHCAEIGYRAVELPLLKDWPADSAQFNAQARKDFRDGLEKNSLKLSALMDNLPLLSDEAGQRGNLDRLKAAAEISQELVPSEPPLVETVLGGKVGSWEEVKQRFVDRLSEWSRVMEAAQVKLAVKCHIGNAMQRPEHLQWLLDKVNSPWLTAAYDYSHFELQQLSLADSLQPLAGRISFVHVKDARGEPGKFQFLLPGEGKTDYAKLFAALREAKYTGDILVEVSGQISSKSDYHPVAAARRSYAALAPALKQFAERTP